MRVHVGLLAVLLSCGTPPVEPTPEPREEAEAPARPEPKTPRMSISAVAVHERPKLVGTGIALEVSATATAHQPLGEWAFVDVHMGCRHGAGVWADLASARPADAQRIAELRPEGSVELRALLFSEGLQAPSPPCWIEHRIHGEGGSLEERVGEQCWDGHAVVEGPCTPAIAPPDRGVASPPVDVLAVELTRPVDRTHGFLVHSMLRLAKIPTGASHLAVTSRCAVGNGALTDVQQIPARHGGSAVEPGSAIARSTQLYWDPAFAVAAIPKRCELDYTLWASATGSPTGVSPIALATFCARDGVATRGPCTPPIVRAPAASDGPAVTVESGHIELSTFPSQPAWTVDVGASLRFRRATLAELEVALDCDGATWTAGTSLQYFAPGDDVRVGWPAFSDVPFTTAPKRCELRLGLGSVASSSLAPASDALALATFCKPGARARTRRGTCDA